MYREAVCLGEIARLCCGAEQILCPQVVLRRRGRFRCSLCGKWMARCGARHERGTGRITHMVDRQPCAWRDYRVVLRRRDRFWALSPLGLGACRGAPVAADGQAFAVRRVSTQNQADNVPDVPGSSVPRQECKVVLQRRAGVVPTGVGVSPSAPCAANGQALSSDR